MWKMDPIYLCRKGRAWEEESLRLVVHLDMFGLFIFRLRGATGEDVVNA